MEQWEAKLEEQKSRFLKATEQGGKVKRMWESEEGQFFFGYLETCVKEMIDEITSTKFVDDHDGYLYTLGVLSGWRMIVEDARRFIETHDVAQKKLLEMKKMEDEL